MLGCSADQRQCGLEDTLTAQALEGVLNIDEHTSHAQRALLHACVLALLALYLAQRATAVDARLYVGGSFLCLPAPACSHAGERNRHLQLTSSTDSGTSPHAERLQDEYGAPIRSVSGRVR